jgi:hypothetical protein
MNPDILAVPRGRRVILRPLSLAGGMFLAEGGEQRRNGSLVVTTGDYEFLVQRCAELGLVICEDPLERIYNLPSREVGR